MYLKLWIVIQVLVKCARFIIQINLSSKSNNCSCLQKQTFKLLQQVISPARFRILVPFFTFSSNTLPVSWTKMQTVLRTITCKSMQFVDKTKRIMRPAQEVRNKNHQVLIDLRRWVFYRDIWPLECLSYICLIWTLIAISTEWINLEKKAEMSDSGYVSIDALMSFIIT